MSNLRTVRDGPVALSDEDDIIFASLPRPSDHFKTPGTVLESFVKNGSNYKDLNDWLETCAMQGGFQPEVYYALPQGYCLALEIERFKRDGSPHQNRHSSDLTNSGLAALVQAIENLVGIKGRFRLILLVVADQSYRTDLPGPESVEQLKTWTTDGERKLDGVIDPDTPVTDRTFVHVLVYEYLCSGFGKPDLQNDEYTPARQHLARSGMTCLLGD